MHSDSRGKGVNISGTDFRAKIKEESSYTRMFGNTYFQLTAAQILRPNLSSQQ